MPLQPERAPDATRQRRFLQVVRAALLVDVGEHQAVQVERPNSGLVLGNARLVLEEASQELALPCAAPVPGVVYLADRLEELADVREKQARERAGMRLGAGPAGGVPRGRGVHRERALATRRPCRERALTTRRDARGRASDLASRAPTDLIVGTPSTKEVTNWHQSYVTFYVSNRVAAIVGTQ